MELCVLVAGIGLLGMLALPLRAGSTDHSRTAQCMDNLRRLAECDGGLHVGQRLVSAESGRREFQPRAGVGSREHGVRGEDKSTTQTSLGSFPILAFSLPSNPVPPFASTRVPQMSGSADTRAPIRRCGGMQPAARSVSLNSAVGVNAYATVRQPIDGPWLDNNHGHTYGRRWRTYGKPEHVVGPAPSQLFTFIDEDAKSINDGIFANGMQVEEWIDWPSTRHDTSGTLAYADAHVEVRRWVDSRTVVFGSVNRRVTPRSPDVLWLRERTSAELPH